MTSNSEAINALQEAVLAIETELGITPSVVYQNVRARLDILEKRQANQLDPSPNAENPFLVGGTGVSISVGSGEPTENRTPGSLYLRQDGYVFEGLYSRRADNLWHRIDTDPWVASGDLSGDYTSQTVVGIQGNSISTATPEDGYRLTWNNIDGYWEPQIGFTATGDLSGTVANQTVVGIQGRSVESSLPNDNSVYFWHATNQTWESENLAVVFDPLHTSAASNIRSNRLLTQSPIDNTKIGIVNLGSDSDLSTTGVTESYSSILGGDKNQISTTNSVIAGGSDNLISNNNYGVLGGGQFNEIYAAFSSVLGGLENVINPSAHYSSITGGEENVINGDYCFVGDGYDNSVSGSYSSIVNGHRCAIGTSMYGMVLSGNNNLISTSSDYSSIMSGRDNSLNGIYSSIVSGNNTSILSDRSIILHGTNVDVSANSDGSTILSAEDTIINGSYSLSMGGSNEFDISGDGYSTILNGINNFVETDYSLLYGDNNSVLGDSNYSLSFGSNNNIDVVDTLNDGYSLVFGVNNDINASYTLTLGSNNIIDSDFGVAIGNKGRVKYKHQKVHSARAIDSGNTEGASQQSNIILDGSGANGGAFNAYIPGTSNHLTLDDNKSYDITIRALIVTEDGAYACARFVYDVLAHVDGGNIVIDNSTLTLTSNSGAPANGWTMSIGSSTNELEIQISASGVEDRRAIVTLEWRELLRT